MARTSLGSSGAGRLRFARPPRPARGIFREIKGEKACSRPPSRPGGRPGVSPARRQAGARPSRGTCADHGKRDRPAEGPEMCAGRLEIRPGEPARPGMTRKGVKISSTFHSGTEDLTRLDTRGACQKQRESFSLKSRGTLEGNAPAGPGAAPVLTLVAHLPTRQRPSFSRLPHAHGNTQPTPGAKVYSRRRSLWSTCFLSAGCLSTPSGMKTVAANPQAGPFTLWTGPGDCRRRSP